ncbi:TPA: AAA family ATPase, partial [Klebsiella pneumoniae]|nr:AAA family ATPase [Klebsiella pneumoniae]
YTRTVYSVNVPVADRYRLENSYRQQKMHFCTRHLSAINDTLETYQFGVRVMLPTC